MSVQKWNHVSDKRLVTGVSGTGKTTFWMTLIKKEKCRVMFVFDHQAEFAEKFNQEPVYYPDELCAATANGGVVIFDPCKMYPGKSPQAFRFFCDFVFSIAETVKGRKIFACDELQKLTNAKEEPEELLCIMDTGRRYQLDCFFISQAPNRIHNAVRNQLTCVYTFRQSDKNALLYLEENSFDPEAIRALPKGKYLWRNLDTGETGEGGEAF